MRAGDLPLSAWWGVAALTKRDVLELQLISAGSVAGLVVGPWLLYHGRRVDPLYKYPCSLSHTIRGPDVVVRGTYATSYAAYLVALRALAARRCSPGMRTTWWLCAVGALHAVVSINYGAACSCIICIDAMFDFSWTAGADRGARATSTGGAATTSTRT